MNKIKTINILGSCVSRDTFGMFENDGGFDIKKCVTNSSVFSLCSPKLSDSPLCREEDFPNSRHYYQRCTMLDINKEVFAYINEYDSDYIMVDLGNLFSKKVMKVQMKNESDPDNTTYITKTQALDENPEFLENAPFRVLETSLSYNDEFMFMAFVYQYAEVLREHFDPKKIIFLELRLTERYIDSEGAIRLFGSLNDIAKKNKYLKEAYAILEQMIPEAHVIKFPDTEILCNMNHKWGINIFHYITEYYNYVLDCVKAISYSNGRQGERMMLRSIRCLYNQLIRERYASTTDGRYSLENRSVISSDSLYYGEFITVCLNASGGTGEYQYETYIKKRSDTVWQPLGNGKNGFIQYKPKNFGMYEVCVKLRDTNNIVRKEYFTFIVR